MKTSETTKDIFGALAKAQGALEAALKDSTNPAFRSKYADLTSHVEAIRPAAKANGLSVIQELTSDDNGVAVVTRICHTSGEWVECGPLFIPASKHDAQGFGSACSYARRYALSAAFGTVADDDDGNAAVNSKPYQVPEPVGFRDWMAQMRDLAAKTPSLEAFRTIYGESPKKHRDYLEKTEKPSLDAMVAQAKDNEAALLAGAKGTK